MKKTIFILAAAILGTFLQLRAAGPAGDADLNVKQGERMPAFSVTMLDGTTVRSADLAGKVVMINFWATWCPPCRAELKNIQKELLDRYAGNRDFVFLAISRGEKRETVEKFRAENGYTFPMGLDPDAAIYKLFAEKGVPRTFIVGKEGKIAATFLGFTPGQNAYGELIEATDKALQAR